MPALFVFLFKVNIALLVFCAGYFVVLRRLTFYTLNRAYLVGAILFATVYPRVNIADFARQHQQIVVPVQSAMVGLQRPAKVLLNTTRRQFYWHWAKLIFWLVAALLAIRLAIQFISLFRIYHNSHAAELLGHKVRITDGDGGPFSFWKNIYINPHMHEPADLKAILMHEQVHVNEWHTADILLAELSTIFYWFNPGIWLMKKAIRENIEFITDRKILQNGIDSKQYQYSLVNVSFAATPQGIVNHFNISTIKKRIIMMNTKRSSGYNLTRYFFLVPVVIVLLLAFTISKAAFVKAHNTHTKPAMRSVILGVSQPLSIAVRRRDTAKASMIKVQPDTSRVQTVVLTDTDKNTLKQLSYTLPKAIAIQQLVDTGKKGTIVLSGSHLTLAQSTYIVDGKTVSDDDIGKIDPANIVSISISVPKDGGKPVTYIRTKNSPEYPPVKAIQVLGSPHPVKTVIFKSKFAYNDTLKMVKRHGASFDTVYVRNMSKLDTDKLAMVKVAPIDSKLFRVAPDYKAGQTLTIPPSDIKFVRSDWNTSVSLSHIADKLVIINGKIASQADLKRLSAFDIDRMVLKTDEETRVLYGDKAKNGVLFIVTKKGDK
jgi:bla regulator protein BlaR1